jgi:hypothetical protein
MKTVRIPIQQRASIAPLGSAKMMKDKLRASNAALVNSMTLLLLLHANHV